MAYDLTLGFVNCNRLHYLKAAVESAILTTKNDKVQIIVVDNASVEQGTDEYLGSLLRIGVEVYATEHRDPNNEYARALNTIVNNAKSPVIAPCPGDIQFIRSNWVKDYIDHNSFTMTLDAQRRSRINSTLYHTVAPPSYSVNSPFLRDKDNPICGAGCVAYQAIFIKTFKPWDENNLSHEGGQDSETKMIQEMEKLFKTYKDQRYKSVARNPPAVAIYDRDGSNAIVRGNHRYGNYVAPVNGHFYYEIDLYTPPIPDNSILSIEDVAIPKDHPQPLDENGNWKKTPTDRSIVKILS